VKVEKENDILERYNPEDLIFALDIGTRTVIGVLGVQENGKFKVLLGEVLEHKSRAMLDGQIHDIDQVVEITKEVKKRLEDAAGIPLNKVAIAAAGRTLKTCEVKVERDIDAEKEIDQELISSLEIEGIQLAQMKLDDEVSNEENSQFYCVGYTVISYYLNGYVISNLKGHRGNKIGADMLATYLPHSVVDSLYAVMNNMGLEVISLTLEPIAAINVAIPTDMRLLNLALVDIGAGTSDIAITKDGSVVAYAMVPIAGDEITERISKHYLVDFNTAEKIKLSLTSKKAFVSFVNVLGQKIKVQKEEILEVINPAIEMLAQTVSQKIIECNGKSPNAVFLIGGGSQLPGLAKLIASCLNIDENRVVIRGKEILKNMKFNKAETKKFSGPEVITPIGIAITALLQGGKDFFAVTVNGRKVRLLNTKKLTVADALILIGFNPRQLIGKTGKSLTFELNGIKKVVRGQYGKAAEIYVNGNQSDIETIIRPGDCITVIPAEDGEDAQVRVSDFVKTANAVNITFNGNTIELGVKACINGRPADVESSISEGDKVYIDCISTIGELAAVSEIDVEKYTLLVNGEEAEASYILKDNDVVESRLKTNTVRALKDNNETLKETGIGQWVIVNGQKVVLKNNKQKHVFVDIFDYISFDLTKPKGNIILKLNGKHAAFTDEIKPGDVIDVYWG
jgi:cell division protein FtsA